jgi:hypothetical protein
MYTRREAPVAAVRSPGLKGIANPHQAVMKYNLEMMYIEYFNISY